MNVLDFGPPLLAALVLAVVALKLRKRSSEKASTDRITSESEPHVSVADDKEEEKDDDKVKAFCFFGSQTGTAEGFAKEIASDLNKAGFAAQAVDLEEVDTDEFGAAASGDADDKVFHLYFMATYGEGDPTDNAIDFMAFLGKEHDEGGPAPDCAKNVHFTVFGLGNTQYEQYNKMGRIVQKRLLELGATEVYPMGLGDDDVDIEEDFSNWREGLVSAFTKAAFGQDAPAPTADNQIDQVQYNFAAVFVPPPESQSLKQTGGRCIHTNANAATSHHDTSVDLSSRHLFQGVQATVVENRELRQQNPSNGGAGSTVHVEFDLTDTGITYSTADNLTVLPANDTNQVREAARFLGLRLDQWFRLEPTNPASTKKLFPTPCTVETALTYFTDLNGAPTRSLLSKLAAFATMPEHRERLLFLASKDGKDDFHRYVTAKFLSVAELFETFPSLTISEATLGPFFEVMPRLKGREFTISSSSTVQPQRVALTVGVVREEKPGEPRGRILNGVCSTYIQSLAPTSRALVFAKESTFKLPADPSTPIVMVGPGTGIAPMRAFIQERNHQKKVLGQAVGETVLFFGCRRDDEDFLYKDELLAALHDGALTALHTAFSRQQANKVYVQHVMLDKKEELWDLIGKGAYIYVCGATSMGRDVHVALVDICKQCGSMTSDEANAFVHALQQDKRYVQELWSS